jgi:hypothetical protein
MMIWLFVIAKYKNTDMDALMHVVMMYVLVVRVAAKQNYVKWIEARL